MNATKGRNCTIERLAGILSALKSCQPESTQAAAYIAEAQEMIESAMMAENEVQK